MSVLEDAAAHGDCGALMDEPKHFCRCGHESASHRPACIANGCGCPGVGATEDCRAWAQQRLSMCQAALKREEDRLRAVDANFYSNAWVGAEIQHLRRTVKSLEQLVEDLS